MQTTRRAHATHSFLFEIMGASESSLKQHAADQALVHAAHTQAALADARADAAEASAQRRVEQADAARFARTYCFSDHHDDQAQAMIALRVLAQTLDTLGATPKQAAQIAVWAAMAPNKEAVSARIKVVQDNKEQGWFKPLLAGRPEDALSADTPVVVTLSKQRPGVISIVARDATQDGGIRRVVLKPAKVDAEGFNLARIIADGQARLARQ